MEISFTCLDFFLRFRCRGGGVKGCGFAKNTRIRVHYYEVLTADQRSSFFPL